MIIDCKKHFIAACFSLVLPLNGWCEAYVVDDSDNFAVIDGQQAAKPSVARPKYDDPQFDADFDDAPAFVKEEALNEPVTKNSSVIKDNAKLIGEVQKLQQEVQELRGQLEVQAHDLKLLQQQQVAFYKDLDSRLTSGTGKSAQTKPATNLDLSGTAPAQQIKKPTPVQAQAKPVVKPVPVAAVSKGNPADEQISYFAAYELVKNKKYDQAIEAMQAFILKYPQGGFTANAEYWLGELYLTKQQYPQAIEHFDVVLNQYTNSSKSAACLLKSGYAYAASGNNTEAKKRLEKVIASYPDTTTAQLATTKLRSLNLL